MMKMTIAIKHKCLRCPHEWEQRTEKKPISCPRCKSYVWDKPPEKLPKIEVKDGS